MVGGGGHIGDKDMGSDRGRKEETSEENEVMDGRRRDRGANEEAVFPLIPQFLTSPVDISEMTTQS